MSSDTFTIIEVTPGSGPIDVPPCRGVGRVDADTLARHAPAVHYMLVRGGVAAAMCSIWDEQTPSLPGDGQEPDRAVGVVGHFAAADVDAGHAILAHAVAALERRGHAIVVGPMDGNTWRRYRLVTERGSEPPFFLEPENPDDWPRSFERAGFTPLARYFSAINADLTVTDPRAPEAVRRFEAAGGRIRTIDPARFEEELTAVHELSLAAFADNFLYTPISRSEFLSMYQPLRPMLRPELILMAEQGGQLVGFMFGLPDMKQAERGGQVDTAIAKSLAVRPGRSGAGLGSVLMDRLHQAARAMGFRRVIHALMHENNRSMNISRRYGQSIRQYTLYGKGVTGGGVGA
jgi:GNAT superfamily N-acetyltransferase